ncbi:hypothetical protein [Pseudoalteromonas sp. OOF1S-7]|uniref:hypothetical protein n=1 Tax=Pseudoalteromonas sp. OOF1S-7 TaxID=2917757 RepID=UPI001EF5EC6D|nr:hypothetical protein [Pseudoalteromonas sp. OOF1S-7]MCG7536626.1 hypothetical protein [Pseudoalteromonas sp. OOF1S-7]
MIKNENSLMSGFRSYEQGKSQDILRILSKNSAYDERHAMLVSDLAKALGVQVKFIMAPLKELSKREFVEVRQVGEAAKVDSFQVSLTPIGQRVQDIL